MARGTSVPTKRMAATRPGASPWSPEEARRSSRSAAPSSDGTMAVAPLMSDAHSVAQWVTSASCTAWALFGDCSARMRKDTRRGRWRGDRE